MSAATINTKISEAVTAQEAGDYATALAKLRSAKMLLAAMPDSVHEDRELSWDRAAIDRAIGDLERLRSASGGMRHSYVTYTAPDDDSE